jgi:hypothetical protein
MPESIVVPADATRWEAQLRWRLGDTLGAGEPAAAYAHLDAAYAHLDEVRVPYAIPGLALLDATRRQFLAVNGYAGRIVFDAAAGRYRQAEPWQHPVAGRYIRFADAILAHGLTGRFAVNLFDAQSWDYRRELGEAWALPVLQSCRVAGQPGVALLSADLVQPEPDGAAGSVPIADTLAFRDKQPRAVWRGQLTGVSRAGSELFWAAAIKRRIFDARHALSPRLLELMFQSFPRFRLVWRYHRSPVCDVGLIHGGSHGQDAALVETDPDFAPWRPLFRPPLDHAEQLQYRFVLCLEGNDCADGLFSVLASNSVAMMPVPRWESAVHHGLAPWTHYIPLSDDLEDLEAQIAWGCEHPAACEAISARARAFMNAQSDATLHAALDRAVLRHARATDATEPAPA